MVRAYVAQGLHVEKALKIAEISRNMYYHKKKGGKPGRKATKTTGMKDIISPSMKSKQAWEFVIINILQPLDLLRKGLTVEIRNDNGPQFVAKLVQEFFAQNHLNQVFTHAYTPQGNGHIESFHAILSEHLDRFAFYTLDELTANLDTFYAKYNGIRLHGSIACLPPLMFWNLYNLGCVNSVITGKNRRKFKVCVPYWELSGNESLREFPVQTEVRRTSNKKKVAA